MLSIQLFQVIIDERERGIREELRNRRLLESIERGSRGPATGEPQARYRDSWRARTPRASATTR